MLVALQPEQVANHWELIKHSLLEALPPITLLQEIDTNKVLECLLSGNMVAWAAMRDEDQKVVGLVLTTICEDYCSNTKSMLIYCIYVIAEKTGKKVWVDGFETLKKYAKLQGCFCLSAYTTSEQVKDLAKWFGGSADYTYLTIPV